MLALFGSNSNDRRAFKENRAKGLSGSPGAAASTILLLPFTLKRKMTNS